MLLGIKLQQVHIKNDKLPRLNVIIANPNHSKTSPKKFGQEI
jgi:hypothetical protein